MAFSHDKTRCLSMKVSVFYNSIFLFERIKYMNKKIM